MSNPQPKILYEDENILAVNKPAGLLTHSDGRSTVLTAGKSKDLSTGSTSSPQASSGHGKTLSDWFVKKFPQAKNIGENIILTDGEEIDRSGIVHRLDKDTSGVILLAKTQKGFDCLKKQFQNHEVKKIYHTIVVGRPRDSRGVIDAPIGKSQTDFRARSANRQAVGHLREAKTNYMVKGSATVKGTLYSLVQAMPQTGRTHQIRVHMKTIGHPVVADPMYGFSKNTLGLTRTALHSFSVEFKNCDSDPIRVEAPYPEDFEKAVEKIIK